MSLYWPCALYLQLEMPCSGAQQKPSSVLSPSTCPPPRTPPWTNEVCSIKVLKKKGLSFSPPLAPVCPCLLPLLPLLPRWSQLKYYPESNAVQTRRGPLIDSLLRLEIPADERKEKPVIFLISSAFFPIILHCKHKKNLPIADKQILHTLAQIHVPAIKMCDLWAEVLAKEYIAVNMLAPSICI